jgi:hypothetical protein
MINILEQIFFLNSGEAKQSKDLGETPGILSKLFGCRHQRLSRPVTTANACYQYCSKCGARRPYDIKAYKPCGKFYRPSVGKDIYYI